jgi:RHS repeat-associated protein
MSTVAYFGYTYSPGGNIISTRREGGDIIYYGYDFRSRLTAETWYTEAMSSIYAFEYAYDGAGNRSRKTRNGAHTYYEYDTVNRLLRSHDVSADAWTYFEYDQRGNTTLIQQPSGTTYFDYNDRDLQSSIHYRTGAWNYFHYDGQMRRYALQDSGGLRYFTHDTDGLCRLAERNAAGTVLAAHARGYAPVRGIGDLLESRIGAACGTYYQYDIYDPQGNVVAVMDDAQNVTGRFECNAWGEKLRNQPPPEGARSGQSAPAWMQLPDDPDDVLRLTRTRTYHSGLGRFLQKERPLQRSSAGSYIYARGDPVSNLDSSGLWSVTRAESTLASAIADEADTIAQLADSIGLDADDWRKWVMDKATFNTTFGIKTWLEMTPTTPLCAGEEVVIPNRILALWAGVFGGLGKWWVAWEKDLQTLRLRGFFVDEVTGLAPAGMTAAQWERDISFLSMIKNLHGIILWGHGNGGTGIWTDSSRMGDEAYHSWFVDWQPEYRLALGILFACDTAAAQRYPIFSKNAIFWGAPGRLDPWRLLQSRPTVAELVAPGAQGTRAK